MPFILLYCIKLTVGLAIVSLFYQLVLRKLTFYNWNRLYLLIYTALCFYIPFIDISPVLQQNAWTNATIVQWVPLVHESANTEGISNNQTGIFSAGNMMIVIMLTGMSIFLFRLLIQFISFRRMLKKASFISGDGMKLYSVNEHIIPFSFGNSIFINPQLHSAEELQEIIRHEFVHVKQRHSIDIIWGEVLCLLNWYNPFAWLLKRYIRQNLEFIADNKVLEHGINKKDYQYLLLKVIGNTQFSIANQFNFSSLKKRIAMMNKLKTAKVHLVRFLLVLPVLAVILLSFRKQIGDTLSLPRHGADVPVVYSDTVPEVKEPNSKGYFIDIKGVGGDCTVVVKDKNKNEVKRLLLTDWNEKSDYYEGLYGLIPPPPVPPPPAAPGMTVKMKLPENVQRINADNEKVTVWLKNGEKEKYDMNVPSEKEEFEKKYGKLPPPPPPPPAPAKAISETSIDRVSDNYEITDKKATIHLRNGKTEVYDLTSTTEKKAFEEKYGKIIHLNTNVNTTVAPVVSVSTKPAVVTNISSNVNVTTKPVINLNVKPAVITNINLNTTTSVIAPEPALAKGGVISTVAVVPSKKGGTGTTVIAPMIASEGVTIVDDYGYTITGKEDVLVTITNRTTESELKEFVKKMKEKDIELSYDEIGYNNKGELVKLTGTMKSKHGRSNFVGIDFAKLILAMITKPDGRVYFKVSVQDNKTVI